VALEVMANSDNVLRAGLTPKYIDIPELVANVKFEPKPAGELLTQPQFTARSWTSRSRLMILPSRCTTSPRGVRIAQQSAAILFCVDGEAAMPKANRA
jgi:mannose-6-phosphate isomerase